MFFYGVESIIRYIRYIEKKTYWGVFMKKIINVTISIVLLLITITGCSKKATIDSTQEWEALFDIGNYEKIMAKQEDFSGEAGSIKVNLFKDGNILLLEMEYEDGKDSMYLKLDEDNNTIVDYSLIAKDIYSANLNEFSNDGEAKQEFEAYCKDYMFYYDFSQQYTNATYDQEKKCYCFDYNLEDSFVLHVEVYAVNNQLEKLIIYDDEQQGVVYTYSNDFKSLELPNINADVNSEEEWKALFSIEKYKNCVAYECDGLEESIAYIDDNVIEKYEYNSQTEEYSGAYYINDSKTNMEKVLIQKEDGALEETSPTYDVSIKNFSDRIIANTIKNDYSGDYALLEKVDDHYELKKDKKTIKFYICGNYINKMFIEDSSSGDIIEVDLYGYGLTNVTIPTIGDSQ